MALDPELVSLLALVGVALSCVLLVAVVVLASRIRRMRRVQQRVFADGSRDVVDVVERQSQALESLLADIDEVRRGQRVLRSDLDETVSRVAVVRYDAFDDMGGALSFSAALLDARGHGMVVSAINGRAETRCYAKPVLAGRSGYSLSAEEVEAISAALEGRSDGAPVPDGRRRRRAS